MIPDTFLTDFEWSENTGELHAMIGRSLIVACRFESMCKAAAVHLEVKENLVRGGADEDFEEVIKKIQEDNDTLYKSINNISMPKDISVALDDARRARNAVCHELAVGRFGNLDGSDMEDELTNTVTELALDLAYGDYAVSSIIAVLNNEPFPNQNILEKYVDDIVKWVVDR